jgi:antitoxin VapB
MHRLASPLPSLRPFALLSFGSAANYSKGSGWLHPIRILSYNKERQTMLQKTRTALSLNVKDPEAHRLAKAIAKSTGDTITGAVTEALRERYERIQKRDPESLAADLRAIAKRAAAHVKRPYLDHAELLYDEHGLPK